VAELSDKARAFLEEPRFAVLATINPDGTPQQTVMWYELRGDHIMMNTAEGRWKERNVRHDARVSVCVEDSYRFVSVNGRVELDEDHATTQRDIYGLARRYNPGFREGDYPVFATQKRITLRISIDKVVTNGV
jgi:PPOX class probable F420-dependent enzyme